MGLMVAGANLDFPDKGCFINYYRNVELFVEKGARLDTQIPPDHISGNLLRIVTVSTNIELSTESPFGLGLACCLRVFPTLRKLHA
jgi:hypothetical protein